MPAHTHKARTPIQRADQNGVNGQGFPNLNLNAATPDRRYLSFRATDLGGSTDARFMFEGDASYGPAIALAGGTTGASDGESDAHNNMPPYAVVLYLIKVKDER